MDSKSTITYSRLGTSVKIVTYRSRTAECRNGKKSPRSKQSEVSSFKCQVLSGNRVWWSCCVRIRIVIVQHTRYAE